MNFEYEWTREDLKKDLTNRRYRSNIIYLIIAIVLYIYFMWNGITSDVFDTKKILIYGLIYIAVVMAFLFIITKIYVAYSLKKNDKKTNKAYGTYHISLDDDSVSVKINKEVISYKYKDIDKKIKKKNSYFINTKADRIGLLFKRELLKDNYDELVKTIESRIK